jgi:hypothetical protein
MRRLAFLLLSFGFFQSEVRGQGSDTTMYYETNWARVTDGAGKRVYWTHKQPSLSVIIGSDSTKIAPRFWTGDFLCWAFNRKEIDSAISVAVLNRVPPRRLTPFANFTPSGCVRSLDSAIAARKEPMEASQVMLTQCE